MAMSTPGSVRVAFWHATVFRRFWVSNVLASFVQPLLYLLGLGVAVGALVDRTPTSTDVLGGVSYVAYIAPGLMVTTAMVVAAAESMWPVMGNFMWSRGYFGVAATPLGAADIVGGHALWMFIRCAVTSASVAAVLVLFPAARSWGLIPAIGAAALTGVAFAMPLMAFAAPRKLDGGFPAMQRFVIIPLFLFGGAFYPISQLPGWTQAAAAVARHRVGSRFHTRRRRAVGGGDARPGDLRLDPRWDAPVLPIRASAVVRMTAVLRITPPMLRDVRRPQRMVERNIVAYRRQWIVLLSGFFEPLFYLLSMRVGLGNLIGTVSVGGKEVPYDHFVAPALMAASAMNGAVYDSTMNVYHKMKWARIYDGALATPMSPGDVALGEITWALIRGQLYAIGFLAVMWALGLVGSPWMIMALPFCALIGLAFASMGFAVTTFMRGFSDFEFVPTATMPMFLFSTTFFPISSYGSWAWVAQLSPLYHGVALVRAANLGVFTPACIGHVLVLLALAAVGMTVAARRLGKLLLS
jgi:lipooligosaccharide transport system permease protein